MDRRQSRLPSRVAGSATYIWNDFFELQLLLYPSLSPPPSSRKGGALITILIMFSIAYMLSTETLFLEAQKVIASQREADPEDRSSCCILCLKTRQPEWNIHGHLIPDSVLRAYKKSKYSKCFNNVDCVGQYGFQNHRKISWLLFCNDCEDLMSKFEALFTDLVEFALDKVTEVENPVEYKEQDYFEYQVCAMFCLWRIGIPTNSYPQHEKLRGCLYGFFFKVFEPKQWKADRDFLERRTKAEEESKESRAEKEEDV